MYKEYTTKKFDLIWSIGGIEGKNGKFDSLKNFNSPHGRDFVINEIFPHLHHQQVFSNTGSIYALPTQWEVGIGTLLIEQMPRNIQVLFNPSFTNKCFNNVCCIGFATDGYLAITCVICWSNFKFK